MTFDVIKDVVLFLLAIYAAGLSTWNLWKSLVRDKRQISVKRTLKIPNVGGAGLVLGRPWADVIVTNIGTRTVTVKDIAFNLEDGRRLPHTSGRARGEIGMPESDLPCSLGDGESASRLHSYLDIGHALTTLGMTRETRIVPICEDSAGGIHKGEPWTVNAHDLIAGKMIS